MAALTWTPPITGRKNSRNSTAGSHRFVRLSSHSLPHHPGLCGSKPQPHRVNLQFSSGCRNAKLEACSVTRVPIDSVGTMTLRWTFKLPSVARWRRHSPALKSDFSHNAVLSTSEQVRFLMRRVPQPGIHPCSSSIDLFSCTHNLRERRRQRPATQRTNRLFIYDHMLNAVTIYMF